MCGRFFLIAPVTQILDAFGLSLTDPGIEGYAPNYNVTPIQTILTVASQGAGRRYLAPAIWGMIPIWAARSTEEVKPLINVRSETVLEKPMYKRPIASGRCLVPASGFYEWMATTEKSNVPHVIQRPNRSQLLALAAIADGGPDPTQRATAILTRSSAGPVKGIHERMPLVIEQDDFDAWLDPNLTSADIQQVLDRALERTSKMNLECYEIGKEINKASANSPDLIEPLSTRPKSSQPEPKSATRKSSKPSLPPPPEQYGLFG